MTGGEITKPWRSQSASTDNEREQISGWLCLASKAEKEAVAHCPHPRNGVQCRYEPPSADERQHVL